MLKYMKAHTNLKPGQSGTRRLVEKYGDALLCVRYRYDELRDVPYTMQALRERLKSVGAKWDAGEKAATVTGVWLVCNLNLTKCDIQPGRCT